MNMTEYEEIRTAKGVEGKAMGPKGGNLCDGLTNPFAVSGHLLLRPMYWRHFPRHRFVQIVAINQRDVRQPFNR